MRERESVLDCGGKPQRDAAFAPVNNALPLKHTRPADQSGAADARPVPRFTVTALHDAKRTRICLAHDIPH